jgi:hypothetical protein
LTSLNKKEIFFALWITNVPFSMIISVIKWSSVKIYVWSAFFHFRQYSYHITRFVILFFPGAIITNWLKRFTFHFFRGLNSRLIGLSIRNGLAVRSEEQAKKVPKIFPTNEIARNKICSVDLLNCHEWRKVGCCRRE